MPHICVIGGGPAGSTFATRMAQLGHDVSLVERAAFPRSRLGESLSPGVLPLLETTGARSPIEACAFRRVRRVHVSWDAGPEVREDPREHGLLVDRGRFDKVLLERAKALGVRVLQPAVVRERRWNGESWELAIEGLDATAHVCADFIADATGRAAGLSNRKRATGCRTVALHAYWRGREIPQEPRIEATRDAWYWGVPLPDGSYNTLAFVDVKSLRAMRPLSLAARFHELLGASNLMSRCRDVAVAGRVLAVDATPYLDEDCVTPRSIKVGEAALAIDPISSSGVQKALQNALAGAIVANTLLRKADTHEAALRFCRDNLRNASERHRRWAAEHYRSVALRTPTSFWIDRAASGATAPLAPVERPLDRRAGAHTPVRLCAQAKLVDLPCLDETFVAVKPALHHPALDGPVAYLGGFELAPLLKSLRPGCTPLEIAQSWAARMPAKSALAITAWLLDNGILVREPAMRAVEVNG